MLFSRIEAGPIFSTGKSDPQMEYFGGEEPLASNPQDWCLEDSGAILACAYLELR